MSGYPQPVSSVVTPAGSYDLTTLATVKDELGLTTTTSDASLARYITAASKTAMQFCNRVFAVETVLDQFWPQRDPGVRIVVNGPDPLQLSRYPVVAGQLGGVTENGVTLVENTDFLCDYALGRLIRLDDLGYPTAWRQWPISAQYGAGFATIPADVADAVIKLVSMRYFAKGRDPALKSESVPGVLSQSWNAAADRDGNLPGDIAGQLWNYRVIPL